MLAERLAPGLARAHVADDVQEHSSPSCASAWTSCVRARSTRARSESPLAEHPRYRVPVLGDRGAPVGIDVDRVVATGTRPVIDIVMIDREPGRGMIGIGLTSPPAACFGKARRKLGESSATDH